MAGRLDRVLAGLDPELSRSAAARLARDGLVRLNGRPVRPADPVREGDVIEYRAPRPEPLEPGPERVPLRVLYDDPDVVVVDKPAGMVVHPSPGHRSGTLVHALLGLGGPWSTLGERPGRGSCTVSIEAPRG